MVVHIGKHTARIERDIIFFRIVSDLAMEEVQSYLKLAETIEAEYGYCFIVDDISALGSTPPAVRRTIVEWFGRHACSGAVLHGGSLTARAVATLVIGAMKILGSQPCPIVFVHNEQEARDWVSKHRHNSNQHFQKA
mgnify:CR=1 FL=1